MKLKNFIRKAGAFVLAGVLSFGTLITSASGAMIGSGASGTVGAQNSVYGQYVTGTTNLGPFSSAEFLDFTYPGGAWGGRIYCIQPGTTISSGDILNAVDFETGYSQLSYDQRRDIKRVVGFFDQDVNVPAEISTHSYYWTYQCLIWHYAGYMTDEQAMAVLTQTRTKNGNTYNVGSPGDYTRIRGLMDEYDSRPSFGVARADLVDASHTYKLTFDANTGTYRTIIHDTTGMTRGQRMNSMVCSNPNITFTQCDASGNPSATGDYIQIVSTQPVTSPVVAYQTKKDAYCPISNNCVALYNGTAGHQNCLSIGDRDHDPVYVYFAVYSDDSPLTISKQDVTTGTELPGASLVLKDKQTGAVIESWTSGTAPHKVANVAAMTPGREYVLCETIAPANYKVAQDVEFVYTGTNGQQVTMYNELHGVVRVYKTGPMLTGTTAYPVNAGGKQVTVNRMDFSAEAFANVTFKIYNARTDAEIATITTDASGYAQSELLPCGQGETYYMKEVGTPAGAVMEDAQIPITIAFDNTNNTYVAPVTLDNGVTSVKISVYKEGELVLPNVEEDGTITYGKKPIEGVYYGLYTGEEIQAANGTIAKDTLVAIGKTDAKGVCVIEEAVVAGKYYVQEISAPEGFVVDDTKHEVNVTYTANSSEPVKEL